MNEPTIHEEQIAMFAATLARAEAAEAELARVQAEYADYRRVAQQSTIESVMAGARLRGALTEVARILQQRGQEGWEERLLGVVNAALEPAA